MMRSRRVFLIVLDSLGIGNAPDADVFGDTGAFTLRSLYETGRLKIPHLLSMGLGRIEGVEFLGATEEPIASVGDCAKRHGERIPRSDIGSLRAISRMRRCQLFPRDFPPNF